MIAKFTLSFEMDNAAFDDDPAWECARILRVVSSHVQRGDTEGTVLDVNGNTVGRWAICT